MTDRESYLNSRAEPSVFARFHAHQRITDTAFDDDEKALRALANTIYSAINEDGDI